MAEKKRMTKKERERRHRRRFWAGILLVSLAAAFCVLVTLSEQMTRPFLPTWKEIFQKVGLAEAEPLDSELRVHVIDVGNADAILVQNKGASLLIDAGRRTTGSGCSPTCGGRGWTSWTWLSPPTRTPITSAG